MCARAFRSCDFSEHFLEQYRWLSAYIRSGDCAKVAPRSTRTVRKEKRITRDLQQDIKKNTVELIALRDKSSWNQYEEREIYLFRADMNI